MVCSKSSLKLLILGKGKNVMIMVKQIALSDYVFVYICLLAKRYHEDPKGNEIIEMGSKMVLFWTLANAHMFFFLCLGIKLLLSNLSASSQATLR